ncbi:efflux RND transporter periplasmic adaptor subunit [Roseimaritima ulvae]|uniref:Putative efflux pump membrane fusion protein n=1 Tax=Roseimaritima ulvae TaxID=980254 RepID=A0A5B9QY67_9BACT|nr:efflux RND transporter periplasmic adaptor subunit [Roseimaritima ulvae]QEG42829.1 putative efflux pump membrane fusion protein [Roseimaritima ulvae]
MVYRSCCLLWLCLWATSLPVAGEDFQIVDAQVTLAGDITIAAATPGIVADIAVTEGQSLEPDALIAQLDDRHAQAELRAAMESLQVAILESENDVDLRYAEMTLAVHQKEYEHSQSANTRFAGSVSQSELRRLQLVVDQAKLRIEQARRDREIRQAKVAELQAGADAARQVVAQHTIHSPTSGVVAQRMVDPGEWVAAGDPVVRVIDLSHFRIEGFVDQADAAKLTAGMEVRFVPHNASEVEYPGVIQFVAAELHPVTGQARLWAEVGNHDGKLQAGMRGTLHVQLP